MVEDSPRFFGGPQICRARTLRAWYYQRSHHQNHAPPPPHSTRSFEEQNTELRPSPIVLGWWRLSNTEEMILSTQERSMDDFQRIKQGSRNSSRKASKKGTISMDQRTATSREAQEAGRRSAYPNSPPLPHLSPVTENQSPTGKSKRLRQSPERH